ncbi:MAG: hypothetical protein ACTSUE_21380 [Promethearchaeota archaeon]
MVNKKVVAMASILVVLMGALGYMGYKIYDLNGKVNSTIEPPSGLVHSWFTRTNDSILVNSTLEPINQLNTSIYVNSGEWVHVSFSCNAKIQITGATRASLEFFILVDGVSQWVPTFMLDQMPDTDNDDEWTTVTFFGVLPSVTAGAHSITIGVMTVYGSCIASVGGGLSNSGSNLLIQTILP